MSQPIDHVLSTTRSVRRKLDLDRPVEDDVLLDCLRLAIQAPTPSNSQAWRWLIVRDQSSKDRLGALYRDIGDKYLQRRQGATGTASRVMTSARHLVDVIERVPVLVVPCLTGRPTGDNASLAGFYGGIFPAVWGFQLALRSRGLGSTLTTFHLHHEAEAAAILGLPDDVTQVALLPVAYTTTDDFKPAPRTPVEDITFLDRWGQSIR